MRCRDWKMKREIGYREECMQSLRKKTRFFKMIFFSIPQVPQSIGSMSVMWAIAHLPLPEPKDSQLVTCQGWCSLKGDLGVHLLRHRHGSNCLLIIPLVIGFSLCGRHITLSAWFGCLIASLNYNYNHYAILRSSFTFIWSFFSGMGGLQYFLKLWLMSFLWNFTYARSYFCQTFLGYALTKPAHYGCVPLCNLHNFIWSTFIGAMYSRFPRPEPLGL